jgi:hypothetical protein
VASEQLWTTRAKRVAKRQRGKDHVVELARDGDEVRQEVDRHRQVADEGDQDELAPPRNPLVREQPPGPYTAVGNEPGQGRSLGAPARDHQSSDHGEVSEDRDGEAGEQRFDAEHGLP